MIDGESGDRRDVFRGSEKRRGGGLGDKAVAGYCPKYWHISHSQNGNSPKIKFAKLTHPSVSPSFVNRIQLQAPFLISSAQPRQGVAGGPGFGSRWHNQ